MTRPNRSQKRNQKRYDKLGRTALKNREGDLVKIQVTTELAIDLSRKLLPKYKGPFRVTKVIVNYRYEVENLREGPKRSR